MYGYPENPLHLERRLTAIRNAALGVGGGGKKKSTAATGKDGKGGGKSKLPK
jgi:hypothetical protein